MAVCRGWIEADVDRLSVVSPRSEREEALLRVERKRAPVWMTVAAQTSVLNPQHGARAVDDRQLIQLLLETAAGRAANSDESVFSFLRRIRSDHR